MSKLLLCLLIQLLTLSLWSQGSVGINTGADGPHESSILDLNSTTKGFKLPSADTMSITNPAFGLMTHHGGITYQYTIFGWQLLLTSRDRLWEPMYDYVRTIEKKSAVVGGNGPLSNSRFTVDNSGMNAVDHGIYSNTEKGVALYAISSDQNSLTAIQGIHNETSGIHYGGAFATQSEQGAGVYGYADNINATTSFGGYFTSSGTVGVGVSGIATSTSGSHTYGGSFINMNTIGSGIYAGVHNTSAGIGSNAGQFSNTGIYGKGVFASTSNTNGIGNDAGVFLTHGINSHGVRSIANGVEGVGVKGTASGAEGVGVIGSADNSTALSINYGGHFTSKGKFGVGVYGTASEVSPQGVTYGGSFKSKGDFGIGVYGLADHTSSFANYGGYFKSLGAGGTGAYCLAEGINGNGLIAETVNVNGVNTYGGTFIAKGISGGGIKAVADNSSGGQTYGGFFETQGSSGRAVYGKATNTNATVNYGGYFEAEASAGKGVLARTTGSLSTGVVGISTGLNGNGTVGETTGASSKAVYGLSSSSTGVNYGGYFTTNSPDAIGVYAQGKQYGAKIDGDVVINSYNNSTAKLSLFEANDYGFQFEYDGTTDNLHLWSRKFSGNEARRMTWQKNGNVGIGTTTPDYALDIENSSSHALRLKTTAGSSKIFIDGTAGSNAIEFLESGIFKSSLGWSETNDRFFIYQQGNALVIKDGNVGIKKEAPTRALDLPQHATNGLARAYAWTTYSDQRIKKNVKEISYGLKELCSLEPKSYDQHSTNFIEDALAITSESEETIGLLAQEVYAIIPEAVQKPEDENTDLWSLDYQKLIPVLIQAIKEQNKIIVGLSSELAASKSKTKDHDARLQKVEAALFHAHQ